MYNVHIWIPTKGWKRVGRARTEERAIEIAKEFDPLETMISSPGKGRVYHGGYVAMPDYVSGRWGGEKQG